MKEKGESFWGITSVGSLISLIFKHLCYSSRWLTRNTRGWRGPPVAYEGLHSFWGHVVGETTSVRCFACSLSPPLHP